MSTVLVKGECCGGLPALLPAKPRVFMKVACPSTDLVQYWVLTWQVKQSSMKDARLAWFSSGRCEKVQDSRVKMLAIVQHIVALTSMWKTDACCLPGWFRRRSRKCFTVYSCIVLRAGTCLFCICFSTSLWFSPLWSLFAPCAPPVENLKASKKGVICLIAGAIYSQDCGRTLGIASHALHVEVSCAPSVWA